MCIKGLFLRNKIMSSQGSSKAFDSKGNMPASNKAAYDAAVRAWQAHAKTCKSCGGG